MKFDEGDEVKALVTDEASRIFEGETYVVEFAYDDDDVPGLAEALYSLAHVSGSAGMEALESQLERTRTRAEMDARKLPTYEQIIQAFPISWGYHSGFDVTESDASPSSNEIEFYGRTEEGLPFGFRVEVVDIWHTDF